MPIRVVNWSNARPELPNTIEVLGKDKVLSRLKNSCKGHQASCTNEMLI